MSYNSQSGGGGIGEGYLPGFGQFYTEPPADIDIKKSFEDFLRGVREGVLTAGGEYIASTPEGRAAIEAKLREEARAKALAAGQVTLPWVPLAIIGALLFLGRGRR